jgi:tRNA nucleotidyltransferase/poly(A) polymerase
VATFRSDGPYSDKRRPDHIEFADARHDAERRDFTVNALFLDPLATADSPTIHGHAIDYVGGLKDLEARVLRAVGDPERRLAEDHLRALRAARFAARYGFEIEPATAAAVRAHAAELAGVSRERIGDELRRMMAHPSRARAVELLRELGLDAVVLGGGAKAAPAGALATLGEGVSFAGCLACWALERGDVASAAQAPGLVARWRRALCLTNEEASRLRDVLAGVLEIEAAWGSLGVAARKRRGAAAWFLDAAAVVRSRDARRGSEVRADVEHLASDGVGLAPEALLDGDDLVSEGWEPGPVFARVLASVYDAQLEGRVRDRAGALQMASELRARGSV